MKYLVQHARFALIATTILRVACSSELVRRAGEDIVPSFDYSWIKRYAALGDSFAAGIGVGDRLSGGDAKACSRYEGGYPNKIQAEVKAQDYQFLACSGAVTQDMIQKQVPQLSGKYDLITISGGGNDVGFSDVLKACLFLPQPVRSFLRLSLPL